MTVQCFRVTESLNLQSGPRVDPFSVLAVLPEGHEVIKVAELTAPWWRVRTTVQEQLLEGFVDSRALEFDDYDYYSEPPVKLQPVHLEAKATRDETGTRAFPLLEADMPRRISNDPAGRCRELHEIIAWLDVEHRARYRPGRKDYCGVYAYDYACLAGVYLPRVWWNGTDVQEGHPPAVEYGKTVEEIPARELGNWLYIGREHFGWQQSGTFDELQAQANQGHVAVMAPPNRLSKMPGHIVVVVPETPLHQAVRENGIVTRPLQSQAGRENLAYHTNQWWKGQRYTEPGLWWHD